MAGTVFAASEEKEATTLRTEELSLYTTPQQKFKYVEPEEGQIEQTVAQLRQTVQPYTSRYQQTGLSVFEKIQGFFGAVKPSVEKSVQFGKDSYEYLKDPPSEFYAQAGVIGFAGILGLFLARAGSRIKKLIYPTGLMALGASLYYPQQAASIAKTTGDSVYDLSLQAYVALETLLKDKSAAKPVKQQVGKTELKTEENVTTSKEPKH
ncbi:MICOS complex subunit MIC26-like isoform X1 [Brienomyrus brachyistius]|uniref:MICOS complex subunit MIC26-like isoform X1 n=1 Tax=Brienomyrus brachyistius TaxID=42636 RepID=UPI0020B19FBB|nr:MICOS complex subunit MIC26-like isoform X1 [Brienomyrus brachyistius]